LCVALMNLSIGTRATDLGPFRAISASALERLGMKDATFGWTTEMQINAHRKGLRTVEVPVNYRCRRGGDSKISGSWPQSVRAGSRILSLILREARAR
ncbi:MAG: glycosyltransferase family 2 protein, partial [Vicinamibacteria bacterium]|nr:glycosyltransferase family 2 protein [Vicinamibacteria bacterium]